MIGGQPPAALLIHVDGNLTPGRVLKALHPRKGPFCNGPANRSTHRNAMGRLSDRPQDVSIALPCSRRPTRALTIPAVRWRHLLEEEENKRALVRTSLLNRFKGYDGLHPDKANVRHSRVSYTRRTNECSAPIRCHMYEARASIIASWPSRSHQCCRYETLLRALSAV